jgi:signal transduction histidine kinase
MIAAVCLTLAAVHGLVWCRRKKAWGNLVFALTAVATALLAAGEVWMMRSQTTGDLATAVRWTHVPAWLLILGLIAFVRLHLRAGRPWLAWMVVGMRTLSLVANFLTGVNLNYLEITEIRRIQFLGEPISIGVGVPNPWMILSQVALVLLVIFVTDAALSVWRRGELRPAVIVGGGMVFCTLLATVQSILVFWGILPMPLMASFCYMIVVAAMGFELSRDVLRASDLADELRESERRMSMATEAANLGIWIRDLVRGEIWATDRWRTLFEFTQSERLDFEKFLQRVHPEDREPLLDALAKAVNSDGLYEAEFRVVLPERGVRWISARGSVEFDAKGEPIRVRGTSRDCTARKQAEEAAHQLSGRLIQAQEDTQKRLARELHDDFSQSLALLSVELEMFGQNPPIDPHKIAARMEEFSARVKGLSSEVHQLSHHLHPAKLDQLGLVAAMRGFCKEFAQAHEMAIGFVERGVPRMISNDTALCLYRIAQEALQNVVKHSGATTAKVELMCDNGHLHLVVADDGAGFDPHATPATGSLGVVSMGERARFVGGALTIASHSGTGTRVEVRVPIAATEETAPR